MKNQPQKCGSRAYGQAVLALRYGDTVAPLVLGMDLLPDPLGYIHSPHHTPSSTSTITTAKTAQQIVQEKSRSAFATALQQARSANKQLTQMQRDVTKLQAEAQALMRLYQHQRTGCMAARGKLSQTAAKLESVLGELRALYAQANAPVAALKQAAAQMQKISEKAGAGTLAPETTEALQQVAQWAKAGNQFRTQLSAINKTIATAVEQAYRHLNSLGKAAKVASPTPDPPQPPELGRTTRSPIKPPTLTPPGARDTVGLPPPHSEVGELAAKRQAEEYARKLQQAADAVLLQQHLFGRMTGAQIQQRIKDIASSFGVNVGDLQHTVQARQNELQAGPSGGVRAGKDGGGQHYCT